jgi:gamma-glutamyl:cysteine ligase YbdK (ATP-grasp superfamily)
MDMSNYHLFAVQGIEIEYMLVDRDSLDVKPYSDKILRSLAGKQVNEIILGEIGVSNELVMHVLELKNAEPTPPTPQVVQQFHQAILNLQPILMDLNLKLLPTGAHPWMNPQTETHRWPYGNKSIYNQYNSIFNCEGHGWSNLQSMHVNLPFANDHEFCQLHNSIRLILPLLPALAASTPILDGKATGSLDSRLTFYERNQQKIPSISGKIIPEFTTSKAQYEQEILQTMYQDIRPYDPDGILQYEWLNSRGAIPKFEYGAIEIRILDSQECVSADIAIAHAIHAILKSWTEEQPISIKNSSSLEKLKGVYDRAIQEGLNVTIDDKELLANWQLPQRAMSLRDAWTLLIERVSPTLDLSSQNVFEHLLLKGNLSERILKKCQRDFSKNNLKRIYNKLGDCLLMNELFP